MKPEQSLYMTMVEMGMKIYPGTLQSLKEAIDDSRIHFFENNGKPSGFVTWYFEDNDLVVNNLCLFQSGVNKLFELRKLFHDKYPNLKRVKWHDDKRDKDVNYVFG